MSDRAEALARRAKPLSQVLLRRSRKYVVADEMLYASSLPVNPFFARLAGARAQALGFHHLFGDGTVRAGLPESAGGDFFVPLADVRNTCHVEAGRLSTL